MLRSSKNADQWKQWWYRVAGYSAVAPISQSTVSFRFAKYHKPETIAFKTCRIKSSELDCLIEYRIAHENLMNYDDATIYHNDKNPAIS